MVFIVIITISTQHIYVTYRPMFIASHQIELAVYMRSYTISICLYTIEVRMAKKTLLRFDQHNHQFQSDVAKELPVRKNTTN